MNLKCKLELAWAAGFFDGEGNTAIGRTLMLSIGQVNNDHLKRFQIAVGAGRITGPYDKGNKPIWTYRAYSDHAFYVFRKLYPYLGDEKRDQFFRFAVRYAFRSVRNRGGLKFCRRGHDIIIVGRYRSDCKECRRIRRSTNETLPPLLAEPTAWSERLHGIREYIPKPIHNRGCAS